MLIQRPTTKGLELINDQEDKKKMENLEGMRSEFRRNIVHHILQFLVVSHDNKLVDKYTRTFELLIKFLLELNTVELRTVVCSV